MAEKTALFESFLSCHVCSETFRDPVSLSCNHSFCSSCLQRFWEQSKNKNCPICKRKSTTDEPAVNLTLKELADSFDERQTNGSPETEKGKEEEEVVCSKHPEVPYWFCKDEDRAVCPVCEFSLHHSHKVVPVEQAVSELKDLLKADLESLQDKRDKYKRVEKTYNEVTQVSKKQLLSTERQIRAEFNKLHQFLKEEEESRLAALREEEEQKGKTISREMKSIQEHISSLSHSISAVEEELQKHNGPFLSSYKATQSRVQSSLSDPQLLSGALTDVAKHLGNLSFRVWEKMKDQVHFNTVILDPNTASPWLYLSDDLTSVRRGDTSQQLPDNPERFTKYADVQGSEGFSSGRHSWEVEVGDHPVWNIGLTKESADRKGNTFVSPEYGIWCLSLRSGKYSNGDGETVRVEKNLQRIRVQLDYDRGEVSFYDPEDMTPICTHRDTFTEELFPWFSIGKAGDAKTADVKICPTENPLRCSGSVVRSK
ncbi:nuclear factor 7, brain-like [Gymnodraco acuticeps]|uniref:Nuclear factor 7, brain-like n=1 Tax=Gymnodraco acuticeps TaxID=8218 RepID=A0A6P8UWB8_GYMAC|nr:nuclear factor 7, brain-like [Gymnodraco acuticeps]